MVRNLIISLLALLLFTGCVRMYAPIVWDHRERVYQIIKTDPLLSALYKRYDPKKLTLRGANGYDEVASPFEVKSHLAAYKATTNIIYVNREIDFTDNQLKEVLTHEICHHIWNTGLNEAKRKQWNEYLSQHPSPLQRLVGLFYPPSSYEVEIFAFTIEFSSKEDIKELVKLSILSEAEANEVLNKIIAEPKHDYWGIGMFDNVEKGMAEMQ